MIRLVVLTLAILLVMGSDAYALRCGDKQVAEYTNAYIKADSWFLLTSNLRMDTLDGPRRKMVFGPIYHLTTVKADGNSVVCYADIDGMQPELKTDDYVFQAITRTARIRFEARQTDDGDAILISELSVLSTRDRNYEEGE